MIAAKVTEVPPQLEPVTPDPFIAEPFVSRAARPAGVRCERVARVGATRWKSAPNSVAARAARNVSPDRRRPSLKAINPL
jgi:hypothetical protein